MMEGSAIGWEHSSRKLGRGRGWYSSHCQGVGLTRVSFSLKTQGGTHEDTEMASVPQKALLELEAQLPVPLTICLPPLCLPSFSPTHCGPCLDTNDFYISVTRDLL